MQCARRSGALDALPSALCYLALARIHTGECAEADTLIDDSAAILGSTTSWAGMLLVAWRGEHERLSGLVDINARMARDRGHGRVLSMADYANAVLHNGTGRYDVALRAARTGYDYDEPGSSSVISPELVEAAARTGQLRLAEPVLDQLVERTEACGTDWALGIQFRSRALLSDGPQAEDLYREAIERLQRTRP